MVLFLLAFYMKAKFPLIIILIFVLSGVVVAQNADEYVCMPCGLDCDSKVYDKPGTCPRCMMQRVKKSTVVFKSIAPEELCGYVAKHDVVLLDVRSKKEFEERATPNYGTLKNAINIPIDDLDSRLSELNAFKNKEIIVYCSHSQRSSRVSYALTQKGFTNITNMAGGLSKLEDESCKK